MIKPKSPCFLCSNRHIRCHTVCDKYNNYKINIAEYDKIIKEHKLKDRDCIKLTPFKEKRINEIMRKQK